MLLIFINFTFENIRSRNGGLVGVNSKQRRHFAQQIFSARCSDLPSRLGLLQAKVLDQVSHIGPDILVKVFQYSFRQRLCIQVLFSGYCFKNRFLLRSFGLGSFFRLDFLDQQRFHVRVFLSSKFFFRLQYVFHQASFRLGFQTGVLGGFRVRVFLSGQFFQVRVLGQASCKGPSVR